MRKSGNSSFTGRSHPPILYKRKSEVVRACRKSSVDGSKGLITPGRAAPLPLPGVDSLQVSAFDYFNPSFPSTSDHTRPLLPFAFGFRKPYERFWFKLDDTKQVVWLCCVPARLWSKFVGVCLLLVCICHQGRLKFSRGLRG